MLQIGEQSLIRYVSAGESGGKAMARIYGNIGFKGLWNGLPVRILMIGTLTAFQWLIYDSFKVPRHSPSLTSLRFLTPATGITGSSHNRRPLKTFISNMINPRTIPYMISLNFPHPSCLYCPALNLNSCFP